MKRFALAALLALAVGSQADAQILRRYAPAYYSDGAVYTHTAGNYYYTPAVSTASYYVPSSTYVTPATWSSYYPTTTWSYPSYSGYNTYPSYTSGYYSYPAYSSGSYYYPRGILGRRGYWSNW